MVHSRNSQAFTPDSHHRVFKDLPQIVVQVAGLVVFCRQDAAEGVRVGYVHEDPLGERFTVKLSLHNLTFQVRNMRSV